jgi:hypothetical protein
LDETTFVQRLSFERLFSKQFLLQKITAIQNRRRKSRSLDDGWTAPPQLKAKSKPRKPALGTSDIPKGCPRTSECSCWKFSLTQRKS